jgi:hypothetical protein
MKTLEHPKTITGYPRVLFLLCLSAVALFSCDSFFRFPSHGNSSITIPVGESRSTWGIWFWELEGEGPDEAKINQNIQSEAQLLQIEGLEPGAWKFSIKGSNQYGTVILNGFLEAEITSGLNSLSIDLFQNTSAPKISSFTLDGHNGTIGIYYIDVTVPHGTNVNDITPPNISITPTGTFQPSSNINFSSPVIYTISSPNPARDYLVRVTVAPPAPAGNAADLSSIFFTLPSGPLFPTFSPGTTNYNTMQIGGSIMSANFSATSVDPAAQIRYKVNTGSFSGYTLGSISGNGPMDAFNGQNIVTIEVLSADSTVNKTYTVTIPKKVMVTYASNDVGLGTVTGDHPSGPMSPGTELHLTATPTSGTFNGWTVSSGSLLPNNGVINPSYIVGFSDVVITAQFLP